MTDRQNDTKSMALFCDFENVALGVREAKYQDFDINKVLERLLLKGSIVVKKAYCDWGRYREFKATMHQASFELIEIPHVRMSGKNSADIRMVVDALDLCYTKSHVDTFVIISGDSDFSPLVSKLRENAKTVIGVGVKNSTSELLINNCDEFIYYDDLVRVAAARPSRRRTGERSGERTQERTQERNQERGAERTGERAGDRGPERLSERGGDRLADRGADRGAERNADRPAERGADRGPDRTRRSQPRRIGIADPAAVQASMAAPEDGVVADAIPSEPVETMLSVSADVIAHLAGDSVVDVESDADADALATADADADADAEPVVEVAPRPAARRPRRKAGAVAAEAVSSLVSAVSVPLEGTLEQPSSDLPDACRRCIASGARSGAGAPSPHAQDRRGCGCRRGAPGR
ncbi:MAG: NYN domain-containing protein [Burkholderiaceae bacterium]|nr:NYN domain-containing protein [Burkholderiaceae bacterium]